MDQEYLTYCRLLARMKNQEIRVLKIVKNDAVKNPLSYQDFATLDIPAVEGLSYLRILVPYDILLGQSKTTFPRQ